MYKKDFYYDLPPELIAKTPLPNRRDSRLLHYSCQTQGYQHHPFTALPELLEAGDLLVLNNSKVIPARFFGNKTSGGRVEFLLERIEKDKQFLAHMKASKALHPGMLIRLPQGFQVEVIEKEEDLYRCQANADLLTLLAAIGHTPLPPYITREDTLFDKTRYQTVYARHDGSVAAPTAGLHFDELMLKSLQEKGILLAYVTLHVGAGTFKPVRAERIEDHLMHREYCEVDEALCEAVHQTRARKKRVIAVGTTALRSLETAALSGSLQPYRQDTTIFIYPGYQFQICDGLITNFHLPESTLLMLVAAFIGHTEAMALYREAIAQKYRFFSYGDTSLLLR